MSSFRCLFAVLALLGGLSQAWGAEGQSYAVTRVIPTSPLTTAINLNYFRPSLKNFRPTGSPLTGHALNLEVEWLPLADLWGKPAIGTIFGYQNHYFRTDGKGQVLHVMPVGLYATYRFDFLHRQWLVPFVKGGGLVNFSQSSRGGRIQSSGQWTYGAGFGISLGAVDTYSARHLDMRAGINDFQITVEYVRSDAMSAGQKPDLSHEEFRFGIRFEI